MLQWWFKTRIVRGSEMDFSPAIVFDEQDRAREMNQEAEGEKGQKTPWLKRVQYVVFG